MEHQGPPTSEQPPRKRTPRNDLNDLDPKRWLITTKSVWKGSDYHLSRDDDARFRYVRNLILFFTKRDNVVLHLADTDPAMQEWIARICNEEGRLAITEPRDDVDFIISRAWDGSSFDTYHAYFEYLSVACRTKYAGLHGVLKQRKYLCVVVQDFYLDAKELVLYHGDLAGIVAASGFNLKGLIVWVPETGHGSLLAGASRPSSTLIHEYILVFEKGKDIDDHATSRIAEDIIHEPVALTGPTVFYPGFTTSMPPPRDRFKAHHPATFPEPDIQNIMRALVHDRGNTRPVILDPFCGVGSALIAATRLGFDAWGIELTEKWVQLACERFSSLDPPTRVHVECKGSGMSDLNTFPSVGDQASPRIFHGDARECMKEFPASFFDFIVTSPPYWGILTKKLDHKTKKERASKGFETKYTVEGEDVTFASDLANIRDYHAFLDALQSVYRDAWRVLKDGGYMAVIVSDFRDGGVFYMYHCKTAALLREAGFKLVSMSVLHQDSKNLYPYGYPFSFVSNIHNQFIVIVKKEP
nr:DNA methyltransferase [Candidatus Sigynarchaeota archaeon]